MSLCVCQDASHKSVNGWLRSEGEADDVNDRQSFTGSGAGCGWRLHWVFPLNPSEIPLAKRVVENLLF
jgi:hypothetical protein